MNARELAKTLVKLSAAQNGTIEAERVKAVCEYVEASVAKGSRLRVLEEYRKAIKPLLQRQSASVETSGELSEETFEKLAARIRAKAGEGVAVSRKVDESLLGGIRVRVSDDIYESSIRADFERLAQDCKTK